MGGMMETLQSIFYFLLFFFIVYCMIGYMFFKIVIEDKIKVIGLKNKIVKILTFPKWFFK